MAGAKGYMKLSDLIVGETYEVSLQQDWTTVCVKEITKDYVIADHFGYMWSHGVPVHLKAYTIDHFLSAFWPAPPGDWSRQYHPDKYNDRHGYPAG